MSINFNDIIETVRIKESSISIKAIVATGKEGEHFVAISPAILVSGYGNSKEEAHQSFQENLRLFCEDLMKLTNELREIELTKLGFAKVKYHNKNYSKSYVDENGVLQGFEPGTLKTSMLEATV
ncbi:hypothetical protein [Flavobacterium sp.]|jgi:hypothetical protein|uniref:hypothetical protein n=1 Tax=Flavobacterium sp. TaxID=239 RepID=UPI003751B26C